MSSIARVFVCSTYVDLIPERRAVIDAIQRLRLQHDSMEFFGARPNLPLETCIEEVRRSDILVIIVGHRYGTYIPGTSISYSEREYSEGYSRGKPCLPYIRSDNVPILPRFIEREPEKMKALEDFKKRLQERHTVALFESAQDLAVSVAADLGRAIQAVETATPFMIDPAVHPRSITRQIDNIIQDALERRVAEDILLDTVKSAVASLLNAEAKREPTVYLSHAASDGEIVQVVAEGLRSAGIKLTSMADGLLPGDSTQPRPAGLASEIDCVVFFISKQSTDSPMVQQEINQAILRRMREPHGLQIIPVRLDDTRVPSLLRDIHNLDLMRSDVERVIIRLVNAIRSPGYSPSSGARTVT